MNDPINLRAAAERYREIARSSTDQHIVDALVELATHYEFMASQLDEADEEACG